MTRNSGSQELRDVMQGKDLVIFKRGIFRVCADNCEGCPIQDYCLNKDDIIQHKCQLRYLFHRVDGEVRDFYGPVDISAMI